MAAGGRTGRGSHRQTVRQKQGLRTDPIHSPCRVFETFQRICSACRRRLQPCQTAQLIQRCAAIEHAAGNQIAVAALFQSLQRLAHAAAAGGCKGDHGLAGKVILIQKGIDDGDISNC